MLTDSQQETLRKYGERITAELKQKLPKASGGIAASVRYEVDSTGLRILADETIIWALNGRGPGKFPPRKPIEDWIDSKGISFDIPKSSLAFLIQRSIAEKGTKAWRQGGTGILESIVTDDLLSEITKEVGGLILAEITSDILKSYKEAA